MGVDAENLFTPLDGIRKSEILFVGRLAEKKGCEILIRAFGEFVKEHISFKLNIIGDGPLLEELTSLAKSLRIEHKVQFLGAVEQINLPYWYRRAAVFVMPSIIARSGDQEGLGLVTAEAMACECPIIVSDIPAVRDLVIDETYGILVPPSNVSELLHALNVVVGETTNKIERAKKARQHVLKRFDWKVVGRNYVNLIEAIIDAK